MLVLTDRLRLRPIAEKDLAAFVAYRSDPAVAPWVGFIPASPEEAATLLLTGEAMAEPLPPQTWRQLAVAARQDDRLLGDLGLCLSADGRQAEIGIALSPANQGRGYGLEALRALVGWLFADRRLHRVHASVDPRNEASIRLMARLGMRCEGHLRRSCWFKDGWVDDLLYGLLAEEWMPAEPTS